MEFHEFHKSHIKSYLLSCSFIPSSTPCKMALNVPRWTNILRRRATRSSHARFADVSSGAALVVFGWWFHRSRDDRPVSAFPSSETYRLENISLFLPRWQTNRRMIIIHFSFLVIRFRYLLSRKIPKLPLLFIAVSTCVHVLFFHSTLAGQTYSSPVAPGPLAILTRPYRSIGWR